MTSSPHGDDALRMPTRRSGSSIASEARSTSTYVNRLGPSGRGKLTFANLRMGAVLAARLVVRVGLQSDYRRHYWRAAGHALRRGQIDAVMGMGFVGYHLIQFTREALRGEQNASFYSTHERRERSPAVAT